MQQQHSKMLAPLVLLLVTIESCDCTGQQQKREHHAWASSLRVSRTLHAHSLDMWLRMRCAVLCFAASSCLRSFLSRDVSLVPSACRPRVSTNHRSSAHSCSRAQRMLMRSAASQARERRSRVDASEAAVSMRCCACANIAGVVGSCRCIDAESTSAGTSSTSAVAIMKGASSAGATEGQRALRESGEKTACLCSASKARTHRDRSWAESEVERGAAVLQLQQAAQCTHITSVAQHTWRDGG